MSNMRFQHLLPIDAHQPSPRLRSACFGPASASPFYANMTDPEIIALPGIDPCLEETWNSGELDLDWDLDIEIDDSFPEFPVYDDALTT